MVAQDASRGKDSQKLGAQVKSICFKLPPPPMDANDMDAWAQERSRMAEDAMSSAKLIEKAGPSVFPTLKTVTISAQHAPWWEEWESNVPSCRAFERFRGTNKFIQRLIDSMGPEVAFRQHGLVGPFSPSLWYSSSTEEPPYRFAGVYTAHIHDTCHTRMTTNGVPCRPGHRQPISSCTSNKDKGWPACFRHSRRSCFP